MTRSTGPACGNNPNHQMTPGDRQAVDNFRAYLERRAAARELLDRAVWVDGDPLMEAIAAAVWEKSRVEGSSVVTDDPRNIAAVAATVARAEPAAVSAAVAPPTQAATDGPETPLEKRLRHSERRNDELRTECKRRGKRVLEQSERIIALERQVDEVQRQLGAEILRAGQAEAELRRMADETPDTQTEAHAPLTEWRVEILDGDEWMPASGLRRDRSQAAEQLRLASERRPLWNDGTRVQRRLVRQTTTYTVEQPAAGARQDGAET